MQLAAIKGFVDINYLDDKFRVTPQYRESRNIVEWAANRQSTLNRRNNKKFERVFLELEKASDIQCVWARYNNSVIKRQTAFKMKSPPKIGWQCRFTLSYAGHPRREDMTGYFDFRDGQWMYTGPVRNPFR